MSTLKTYFNNLEKEILRQDPEFMNLLRDIKEDQKRVRAEKNKIREAKTQYIWNYPSFTLTLQYKNKLSSGLYFEEIQRDWLKRQKDKLVITEADVDWTPMSYPTKDLMLFEELTEDKMAIIDAYGLSYYLFSQAKGSTFSNVKEGMRMTYQDTIIPETEQMYATISHQLGLTNDGLLLIPDFSHVAVLQDDKNAEASAMNLRADAVNKIITAGVQLSDEEKRTLLGL